MKKNKIFLLLLIISLLYTTTGCNYSDINNNNDNNVNSNTSDKTESKKFELTSNNFEKYFNASFNWKDISDGILEPSIEVCCSVEGATSNYDYNDVVIKLNITFEIECYDMLTKKWWTDEIEGTFPINCDIGGNGSSTIELRTSTGTKYVRNVNVKSYSIGYIKGNISRP